MEEEPFSRRAFKRINELMRNHWTRILERHFGDEIQIGPWEDLPPGQVWMVKGETCVGENTVLEREVLCFAVLSPEFRNTAPDVAQFYQMNDDLSDELANLINSALFRPVRQCLADELYEGKETGIVPYHMTIWGALKDLRGARGRLSNIALHFAVNSPDPNCFEVNTYPGDPSTLALRAFLSHTAADKPRLKDLRVEMKNAGIHAWYDEAELRPGDSLTERIGAALERTDIVYAFISRESVKSRWVQKELNVAGALEVQGIPVTMVPVLLDRVPLPPLLADKLYVDLSDPRQFLQGCAKLFRTASARFWRMRAPTTYRQARGREKEIPGWHLPDVREANHARTCMICSELEGYNRPIWTSSSQATGKILAVEGIRTRTVDLDCCSSKLDCILVPD